LLRQLSGDNGVDGHGARFGRRSLRRRISPSRYIARGVIKTLACSRILAKYQRSVSLEEFALPRGEEADTLLAGLARMIELRGAETFVAAPILRAEPQFFPDPVEQRAKGISVLLRRLLAYAGLAPRRIDVEIYGPEVCRGSWHFCWEPNWWRATRGAPSSNACWPCSPPIKQKR
jgi:hypothetical protein